MAWPIFLWDLGFIWRCYEFDHDNATRIECVRMNHGIDVV